MPRQLPCLFEHQDVVVNPVVLVNLVGLPDQCLSRLACRTNTERHHGQRRQAEQGAEPEDVVHPVDENGIRMGEWSLHRRGADTELSVAGHRVEGSDENGESQCAAELLGDIDQPGCRPSILGWPPRPTTPK